MRVKQPPHIQFSRLICTTMTAQLYTMPKELLDDPLAVDNYIEALANIRNEWARMSNTPEDNFTKFLDHICILFSCAYADETKRPSVRDARQSRNEMYALATGSIHQSEFAKAMQTYELGRLTLHRALEHSKIGLEDEACAKKLFAEIEGFEVFLEPAMVNLGVWLEKGNDTNPQSFESLR